MKHVHGLIGMASLMVAGAAWARPALPIVNPGFELTSRPLMEGEVSNGAGGVGVPVGTRPSMFSPPQFDNLVEIPGWRTYLPPPENPDAMIWAGVLRSPSGYITGGLGGANVAQSHHMPMQQTLDVRVKPDTRYTLTFRAGIGVGDTSEGIYVSLLAAPDLMTPAFPNFPGVTTLGITQGQYAPHDSSGELRPYVLEVTTPAALPDGLGSKYLAISFVGSDGIPRMNFDDFHLQAARLPGPSSLVVLVAGAAGARRRR